MTKIILALVASLGSNSFAERESAHWQLQILNNTVGFAHLIKKEKDKTWDLETKRRLQQIERSYKNVRPFFSTKLPEFQYYDGRECDIWNEQFNTNYYLNQPYDHMIQYYGNKYWQEVYNAPCRTLATEILVNHWLETENRWAVKLRLTIMKMREKLDWYYTPESEHEIRPKIKHETN